MVSTEIQVSRSINIRNPSVILSDDTFPGLLRRLLNLQSLISNISL